MLNKKYQACIEYESSFLGFFGKTKKKHLNIKCMLLAGPAENLSHLSISQILEN